MLTMDGVRFAGDAAVRACVYVGPDLPDLEHDYRPFVVAKATVMRCVHCHAIACGHIDETDPCIEPARHTAMHRTRLGIRWARNKPRPKRSAPWPAREDV